jgi:hypothetical protein
MAPAHRHPVHTNMEHCMRKQIVLGAAMALGMSAQAFAADGISYNLFDGGYVDSELDLGGATADGDGFRLGASAELGSVLFGFVDYSNTEIEDVNLGLFDIGLGSRWALGPSLDLVSGASFERIKIEDVGSDEGYGLSIGLRGRVSEQFELAGSVKYVDFGRDSDDMVYSANARWYFTPQFAVGVDISKYDDLDLTSLGLSFRYDFGKSR